MVSGNGTVSGRRISTVVPATITGEDVVHQLTNMDLAMKLHYLRGVYYFRPSSVVSGLTIATLKAPMFLLLQTYCPVAGRVRSTESGRPLIRCNDSGVRIVEAKCDVELDVWLQAKDQFSREKELVPDQVIGPHIQFSPLVLLQFTWFKCGGLAIGFSWSHLLGDATSALKFINLWGKILGGKQLARPSEYHQSPNTAPPATPNQPPPHSIKQVDPIENHWVAATENKMETFSFHITESKLKSLQTTISSRERSPLAFEAISALFWQCLAKIRNNREPKVVTICRTIPPSKANGILSNEQIISTVKAEPSATKAELSELARLIAEETDVENTMIEGQTDVETGRPDFVMYGANLTFVDVEGAGYYGLELKGQKPALVSYSVDGVGDGGAVLVQQGGGDDGVRAGGRLVNVILPGEEIMRLRQELERVWGIA